MPDPDLTPPADLDVLAAALAKLRPAAAAAEKPAFLFRAGQASRDGVVRRWQVAFAAAVVALLASVAVGYLRAADFRDRAEVAEAKLHELTLAVATKPVPPPPSANPAPTPAAPPVFRVPEVRPQPPHDPYTDPDPSPQELADALRLRNEILLGGLTLLPESKPPAATPGDLRQMLPGGVYATPRHEPKKPQPIFPDDGNEE